MNNDVEDWVKKCMSCIHCYRKRNDADYIYCRLKTYCRYETKKKKNGMFVMKSSKKQTKLR